MTNYTVAFWSTNKSSLDSGPSFGIDDTAGNISAALNSLNSDSHISQIIISDNSAVVVSVTQLTSDSTALSLLINQNGSAAALTVNDTSAHIGTSFSTIAANAEVSKIVVSDNAIVTLTASQVASNLTAVHELINNDLTAAAVKVKDTAANITLKLDAIQSAGSTVTSIVVSNNAVMTLSAAQISNDAAALNKVSNNNSGTVSFKVSDTGANIGSYLDALQANTKISTITDSDNGAITVTVAQITSDAGALAKISGAYTLNVADNASDVASAVSGLNSNTHVASIAITDSAANVQSNLDALAGVTKSVSIALTNGGTPAITVTETQFHNDSSVLADITSSYQLTVTGVLAADAASVAANGHVTLIAVSDSAANVAAKIDALEAIHAKLEPISLTDGDTPTLTITETQYNNDGAVLADISSAYQLTVTNVLAADVTAVGGGAAVSHITVNDTAANIATNLAALQNDSGFINSITITDGSAITISVAQLTSSLGALAELLASDGSTPGTVTISDTAADITAALSTLNGDAQVTKIIVSDNGLTSITISDITSFSTALNELYQSDGTTPAQLTVTDSAANISGALDSLNDISRVSKIIVSDSGSGGVVTISAALAASDGTALGELYLADGTTHAHVTVSDTGENLSSAFDALNGNSHVSKILVSDSASGGTVVLSAASAAADTTALGELYQASGIGQNNVVVHDSAANVSSALDSLNSNSSHINQIVVTDSSTQDVVVTIAQLSADATILSKTFQADGLTQENLAVRDTAANISSDLDTLNSNTRVKFLIVSDSGSNQVQVSVAQLTGDSTALSQLTDSDFHTQASVTVSDTAASIQTALDTLSSNSQVNKIIVSDSNTNEVSVSVAQLTSDSHALSELYQADGTTQANVAVSDTAAAISGALGTLNTDTQVDHVTISDSNPLTLLASQVANDTTALAKITNLGTIDVTDTAANIGTYFDQLNDNVHVSKIVISDSGSHEVTISATQAGADTAALGEIYLSNGVTHAHVAVSDTASAISSAFDALNGNASVNKIIVSDSASNEVTLSIAQLDDGTALTELYNADGTTAAHINISDTGANITFDLSSLNGAQIDKIIVSDNDTVAVNVSELTSDATAIAKLYASDGTTPAQVQAQDIASVISAAFDSLNTNTHVGKIVVVDSASNEVTISAAQAASDTTALGNLYQADDTTHAHVAVSDTAADISTALDALNGNTHVNKIIVSDSASNEVTITAAQAGSDGTALGELYLANGTTHANAAVSDTALNISGALDTLNGNTHINKIIVSDSGSAQVAVTVAQLTTDAHALGELYNSNGLTEAGVNVADTAANISAAVDALANNSQLFKIIVTDSASNEVTVSVAQLTGDAVSINSQPFYELIYQADGTTHADIAVSDTGAAISSGFDALNGAPYLNKIIINDSITGGFVSISVAQAADDTTALNELYASGGTIHAHVAVSDTAANITSALNALNSNTHVSKIVVTDSASHEVSVSIAQLTSDATALNELYQADGGTPAHVAVSDTAADIQTALDTLNTNTQVDHIVISDNGPLALGAFSAVNDATAIGELSNADSSSVVLSVSDTAENIATYLDQLNGESNISAIVISDSNPLTLTAAQIEDTSALDKLSNADSSGVTINVVDTGAHISTHLDALQANSDISTITDSDDAPLTVTVEQLDNDGVVLSEITNSDGTTPATIDVEDTAANIEANLADLNANATPQAIIISDSAALAMTVSQFNGDTSLLSRLQNADHTPYALAISDNAAHISTALDALSANSHVATITNTNDAAITLSIAQIASDASALGKLVNQDNSPYKLSVNDSAANITTALDSLSANSHVSAIVVTDSASHEITVNAGQIASDAAALSVLFDADGTTQAHVKVLDIASNIQSDFDSLNGNTRIDKITVSDSASAEVTLSVALVQNDTRALGELYNADGTTQAHVAVSDTGGNISAAFDALNGNSQVNKIIDSDGQEVAITVAQIAADTTALGELYRADGTTPAHVKAVDTASAISVAIDSLNGNTHVNKLVVTDSASNEVTVSVTQLGDTTALGELFNADGTTQASIAVSDTAADIQAVLSTLNGDTQVNKIVVSDSNTNEVTVSVAQLSSASTVLGELYNADGSTPAHIHVSDTAADISGAALDALSIDTQVNKILVSDSASNNVVVSAAQIVTDAHALSELYVSNGSTLAGINVNDTAANIGAALNSFSSVNQLDKIIVSDSALNEVVVSVTQLTTDNGALANLFDADGTTLANVIVSDSSFAISESFDSLNSDTQVNKIIASDDPPGPGPEVTISVAQLTGDTRALGELYQHDGTTLAEVRVHDSATNISTAFDTLNGSARVNAIAISGGGTVIIDAAQSIADTTALGELYTNGSLAVHAHVTVADSATDISNALDSLNGNTHVNAIVLSSGSTLALSAGQVASDTTALSEIDANNTGVTIDVTDTAANISANLDALEANNDVSSITISNNAPVTVSVAQLQGDGDALGALQNADSSPVALTVRDTAAAISADLTDLAGNSEITSIVISDNNALTLGSIADISSDAAALAKAVNADSSAYQLLVSDNATNISAALDTLNGNSHIETLTVTGNGAITVSVAQIADDATILGKLVNADSSPYALAVRDSAADITGGLDSLNTNSHVLSISVTDSVSNEVQVSVAQLTSDATALGKLFDTDGTTHAHVTVADTAAHITTLDFSTLAAANVDVLDVSDAFSLNVARYTSMGSTIFASGDSITLSDTGANIAGLSAVQIGQLAAHGIDTIDASDNVLNFTVAQYDALGTVVLHGDDTVTLQDVAINLETLDFSTLAAKGVTALDATDDVLTLTAAQYSALGSVALTAGDLVTISDTAAHITALDFSTLAAANVDVLDVSDAFSLNVARYTSMGSTIFASGDSITLSDTGANIAGLSAVQIGQLAANGIDTIDASDNTLTISEAQFQALGTTTLTGADSVTISDTAANIVGGPNYGTLAAAGIDFLNATTPINVTVNDISNLGAVVFTAGSTVTLADTGAHIAAVANFTTYGTHGVDKIDASNNTLTMNATQFGELGSVTLTAADTVTISDTAAHLGGLTFSGLAAANVDFLNSTNSYTNLTVQNVTDLGAVHFTAASNVTLTDTAADIQAASDFTTFATHGVDTIKSSDNALSLTVSQLSGLGTTHLAGADAVTLADTAANLNTYLDTAGTQSVLSTNGVDTIHATGGSISVDVAAFSAVHGAGAVFASGDSVTLSDSAATLAGENAAAIAAMAGQIDSWSVSDSNTLTLNLSQLDALSSSTIALTQADTVEFSDTAGNLDALSAAQLLGYVTQGVDIFYANDSSTMNGDVAQMFAILDNGAIFVAGALVDTAANIETLTSTQWGELVSGNVVAIDVTSGTLKITVADFQTVESALHSGALLLDNTAVLADTGAALSALTVTQLGQLAGDNIGSISATGDINFTLAQIDALGSVSVSTTGNFILSDTAAHISAGLDGLNSNTQINAIVISDNAPLTLSAAQAVNDATALGKLSNADTSPVALTISDTAANVATYLGQLNAIATISSITIADNNPLTLTAAQIANDGSALGKLANANASPVILNVADTAANIGANLDALENNAFIGVITVTDNLPVTVTTAQLANDSDALGALVNADSSDAVVTVRDTGANIQADLGNLNAESQVTSIVVSNSVQLTLTVATVLADSHALAEVRNANSSTAYQKVSDTAAHIAANLDALSAVGSLDGITVSNNVALTLTAAQAANDGAVLGEVVNKNGGSVSFLVVDTAANISTNLDGLGANAKISKITVSDNSAVTVNVAQLTSDAAAIAKLVNQNATTYTLNVQDTASDISAALNTLNPKTHVATITVSDNAAINVSVAQLTSDATAIGKLHNQNSSAYSLTISDTAAHITTALDSLNANGHVHKIIVTDSGSGGAVTITAAQAASDATALGELYQAGGVTPLLATVSDTAANIGTALDALNGNAHVGTIVVSDNGTLAVSALQVINDLKALGELQDKNGSLYKLAVTDTAANISTAFDALNTNTHVKTVAISDSGTLALTYTQFQNDKAALGKFGTAAFTFHVTGVTGQTAFNHAYTSFTQTNSNGHVLHDQYFDISGNLLADKVLSYNQTEFGQTNTTVSTYTSVPGQTWTEQDNVNDSSGNLLAVTTINNDASVSIKGYENGMTFTSSGATETVTLFNSSTNDSFSFNGHFGKMTITGYTPGSDTLNFDHNDFANTLAVEAHTTQDGHGNTIVTLDSGDTITITGVTNSQFEAHTADWHFV